MKLNKNLENVGKLKTLNFACNNTTVCVRADIHRERGHWLERFENLNVKAKSVSFYNISPRASVSFQDHCPC